MRAGVRLAAAAVLTAAVHAQQQPAPQQPQQPVFRSGVQIVEVDVRVFDRDGRFIEDLTAADFEVLENGVAQPVQSLFLVRSATTAPTTTVPTTPTTTVPTPPTRTHVPTTPRQTWIFLFDLHHLSPGAGFDRAREAVEAFIRERFRDGDVAGVVAGSRMVNNRLTSVREELLQAVASVKPTADSRNRMIELTREWPRLQDEAEAMALARNDREAMQRAVMRACAEDPDACKQVPPDVQIREKANRMQAQIQRATADTLTAMNALAAGLARMPGPKTIVFLSDGFVTEQVETSLRTVVGQTARAGARVYAIDVRGLNRGRGAGIIDQGLVHDEAGGFASMDALADGPNSLAIDTGGMMIRNENNIGRALNTIAEDANRYYVLAYEAPNHAYDGTYRPIEVRVKRDGVRVRARRGYLALEPSTMLTPQPIRDSVRDEPSPPPAVAPPPAAGVETAPPVPPAAPRPPAAPPAAADLDTARLRPDVADRVSALSKGEAENAASLATRGWEAYQRGDVEAALPLLTEAVSRPGARPWAVYVLGLSQAVVGSIGEAAVSWERVRRAAPDFFEVYMDLTGAYLQLSQPARALAVLRDAEARWPRSGDVHNAIGVIHVRREALDEAVQAFTRATAAAPDDAVGWFNLGRAYDLRYQRGRRFVTSQNRWVAPEGDKQKAAEAYRRCVALGGPYAPRAEDALRMLEWQS